MSNNFKFIIYGQTVLRYRAPTSIVNQINSIYETMKHKKKLPTMRNNLIGKITSEHSLFWGSNNESTVKKHNFLNEDIMNFFKETVVHYLEWNKVKQYKYKFNSVWLNEMKAGEYNPLHMHEGDVSTGLSSVMFLKIPKSYGKETTRSDSPHNGQLTIMGNSTGQFSKMGYMPGDLQPGDFFIFPYDIMHSVMPYKGKEVRRTLAMNVDVTYSFMKTALQ